MPKQMVHGVQAMRVAIGVPAGPAGHKPGNKTLRHQFARHRRVRLERFRVSHAGKPSQLKG